jgi:hypothetical protein
MEKKPDKKEQDYKGKGVVPLSAILLDDAKEDTTNESTGTVVLQRCYFTEERFTDPNHDAASPTKVAKWRMKQRVTQTQTLFALFADIWFALVIY